MSFRDNFTNAGKVMTFIFEIDLTSGYITEIVAQRSGDLQIQNFTWPSAQLLMYAKWPPDAHEFDTPAVMHLKAKFCLFIISNKCLISFSICCDVSLIKGKKK